jgi:hypothetical protein
MANDSTKVAVGAPKVTGAAFTAVSGTTLPTTEVAALHANFKLVGYLSEAGLVQHIGTDSTDVTAWGGDIVRRVQTTHDVTYDLEMIETNEVTQGVYYGTANVVQTDGDVDDGERLAIQIKSTVLPRARWVFEFLDGDRVGRLVLPDAQVTGRGDVTYVHSDAVRYPVTLTAYPDSSGVKGYLYWDDGVLVPA